MENLGPARRPLLLVSDPTAARAWASPLEAAGYTVVLHDRVDHNTYRWIRDDRPAAVVVDAAARDTLPLLDLLRRSPWAAALPVVTAHASDVTRVVATLS
jgi:hypothetical protein